MIQTLALPLGQLHKARSARLWEEKMVKWFNKDWSHNTALKVYLFSLNKSLMSN